LSIFETSFNAHPDALAVALLTFALVADRNGHHRWLGVCCGAAVAAKVFAILLVPFLLWRRGGRAWAAFVLVLSAFYLPFWLQGSTADFEGLRIFARDWEFNSSLFALLAAWLDPWPARVVAGSLFGLVWLGLFIHRARCPDRESSPPPGQLVFGAFLICSPTFNPWYALWLLPFVALRPAPTGVALLVVVSLSYVTTQNLGRASLDGFAHPAWVRPLEFGLVGLALAFQWIKQGRRRQAARAGPAPRERG
jgi:uncharacterized membrane protein